MDKAFPVGYNSHEKLYWEADHMLTVGTMAPDFTFQDQSGAAHTLSSYRGKKVLLYFYPKDNTPGCSKQAAAL